MEHPDIRVLFYSSPWSLLGLPIRALTGSYYTHVEVILCDVLYKISLWDGTTLTVLDSPRGVGGYQEELRIPLHPRIPEDALEFPSIVLNQRISLLESVQYHILRTFTTRYKLTTPVVNCVSMCNIILNHNLDTNVFNGYTPDDLYAQIKRYNQQAADRQQRTCGLPEDEGSIPQV